MISRRLFHILAISSMCPMLPLFAQVMAFHTEKDKSIRYERLYHRSSLIARTASWGSCQMVEDASSTLLPIQIAKQLEDATLITAPFVQSPAVHAVIVSVKIVERDASFLLATYICQTALKTTGSQTRKSLVIHCRTHLLLGTEL